MLTSKEIQHIAKLARLEITKKEEEEFKKGISSVLDYAEKLKEVDVSDTEPTSHHFKIENVFRQDSKSSKSKVQNLKLLDSAPAVKDGYVKVRPVFN